jgi:hypothetical protein
MTPIIAIIVALVLIFVAFRVLMGAIKFGVIGIIVLVVLYLLATGKLG